MNPSEITIVFE